MNKKLLTVAIGTALGVVPMLSAQADVKIGGRAQVEAYSARAECNVGTNNAAGAVGIFVGSGICSSANPEGARAQGLIDAARGRFWITADEDLGAGLKGLAHFEFSVDTANSGQPLSEGNSAAPYDTTVRGLDNRNREKFVGISGAFGTLKLGHQESIYKHTGGARWDMFHNTVLEARGNGGSSGGADVNRSFAHNGRVAGAIKYESNKALGDMVAIGLLYAPHKSSNGAGDTGTGNDYQVSVSVKPIKDLEIVAAHSNNKSQPDGTTAGVPFSDQTANKVGVRFSFLNMHTLFAQYEKLDMNNSAVAAGTPGVPTGAGISTATVIDGTYLLLGYSLKLGSFGAILQGGKHEREVTAAFGGELEADYAATGVTYNLSKTMYTWLGYRQTEATQAAVTNEQKVVALGMRKDF